MKKIIIILAFLPFSLYSQNFVFFKNNVIINNTVVGNDTLTSSVKVLSMPQYEYEFKLMLNILFDNLKFPNKAHFDFFSSLKLRMCGFNGNYSKSFDCLLLTTNDFIYNNYKFKN